MNAVMHLSHYISSILIVYENQLQYIVWPIKNKMFYSLIFSYSAASNSVSCTGCSVSIQNDNKWIF